MHPLLSVQNNPLCTEQIEALKACHSEAGYWEKMFGACNEPKSMLDVCLRAQKKVTRKTHLQEARAERARWHEACADLPPPEK